MKPRITVAIAIPFLLAACSHSAPEYDVTPEAPQPAPAGVNLAGTWLYNPDASDQPGQMGGGGYGGGRRGGFGGGFGGRGGFGGGGRGEGGDEGGGRRRGGGQPDSTMTREPPGRLVIAQDDSSLTISPRTPRDSVSNTLFFDGRDVSATALGGAVETLRGRWNKSQFVVSRDLPGGGTLTESYEVTKHGQRLVIHVKIDRGRNASEQERVMPEFRRVYDRYGS
jgi:hypothetical protein